MIIRSIALAAALCVLAAFGASAPARAQGYPQPSGTIQFTMIKAAYFVGGRAGEGVLNFQGRSYPISIGGISFGLSIGGSTADVYGEVYNLSSPYDIEGAYGAAQASYAVAGGEMVQQVSNARGVELHLRGNQIGLELSLDLAGMAITLQ